MLARRRFSASTSNDENGCAGSGGFGGGSGSGILGLPPIIGSLSLKANQLIDD
jgi:hypothetical protein